MVKIIKRSIISVFIFLALLLLENCNQMNAYSQIPLLLKNGPNIIYNEFDKIDENNFALMGRTVFYNINTHRKIIFPFNTTSDSNPILLKNGKILIYFGDNTIHYGSFFMYDFRTNQSKKISIKNRLNFRDLHKMIYQFDAYNDSTIIFNFDDKIYTYCINNNKLQVLKEIKGKSLYQILYNKQKRQVCFDYASKPGYSFGYLGIYFIDGDSLRFTKNLAVSLNNASKDGNSLIFNSTYGKTGLYDIVNNKVVYNDFIDKANNKELFNGYFLDNNNILFENVSFYIYNLNKNLVVNKILDQITEKTDIHIY